MLSPAAAPSGNLVSDASCPPEPDTRTIGFQVDPPVPDELVHHP